MFLFVCLFVVLRLAREYGVVIISDEGMTRDVGFWDLLSSQPLVAFYDKQGALRAYCNPIVTQIPREIEWKI